MTLTAEGAYPFRGRFSLGRCGSLLMRRNATILGPWPSGPPPGMPVSKVTNLMQTKRKQMDDGKSPWP